MEVDCEEHDELPVADAAEERLLAAAASYWRAASAVEKRALLKLVQRRG